MKKRLVICGNYGVGNVGDDAILRALLQQFSDFKITVMAPHPFRVQSHFGVDAVPLIPNGIRSVWKFFLPSGRRAFRQTVHVLRSCDRFLLGGGTLLTDEPPRAFWIWALQLEAALRYARHVEIHANGLGPFKFFWSKAWMRRLLHRVHAVRVRDERSLKWVNAFGRFDVELVQDPVFDWQLPYLPKPSFLPEHYIVFAPRYWSAHIENTTVEFKKFIQFLALTEGKKVIGIPFEMSSKKDLLFLNTIFEQIPISQRPMIWSDYASELDVLAAIAHADLVIGMRLHSLIFAHVTKTPFIGISYMEKVQALGESLNRSECILDLARLTSEDLIRAYSRYGVRNGGL